MLAMDSRTCGRLVCVHECYPLTHTHNSHTRNAFIHTLHCIAGGDELNVAIALAKLGHGSVSWASVLPTGPLGDVVLEAARSHKVDTSQVSRVEGDIGIFTVLPEKKTVHYQRRHAAFAQVKYTFACLCTPAYM